MEFDSPAWSLVLWSDSIFLRPLGIKLDLLQVSGCLGRSGIYMFIELFENEILVVLQLANFHLGKGIGTEEKEEKGESNDNSDIKPEGEEEGTGKESSYPVNSIREWIDEL